jgi:hypothetical protein
MSGAAGALPGGSRGRRRAGLPAVRDSGPGAASRAAGSVHRVRTTVLAESECAGWMPVHPSGVHAGGVSGVDREGGVGHGRKFSTPCSAPLDPPNCGYSLLTLDGRRNLVMALESATRLLKYFPRSTRKHSGSC